MMIHQHDIEDIAPSQRGPTFIQLNALVRSVFGESLDCHEAAEVIARLQKSGVPYDFFEAMTLSRAFFRRIPEPSISMIIEWTDFVCRTFETLGGDVWEEIGRQR